MTRERAEEMAERARRFGYCAEVVFDPAEGGWYVKIAERQSEILALSLFQASLLEQIDAAVRPIVQALWEAGIETDWACCGEQGHMSCRPIIRVRDGMFAVRSNIEGVLKRLNIDAYWLSEVTAHGDIDTHGGEPFWLIELPGRFDALGLPVPFSAGYQVEEQTA